MILPIELQKGIDAEIDKIPLTELLAARIRLTDRYRLGSSEGFMKKAAERAAYLATRLPATFAVIERVFNEVAKRADIHSIKTLLDLGAGPGSVMWAASIAFPSIESYRLIENDTDLISIGKRLANFSGRSTIRKALWEKENLEKLTQLPASDVIVFSYSIGELSPATIPALIEMCWKAANFYLIIIEPGNPEGYQRIRTIREQLINLGAHPIAPCPHALECPIKKEDWCHFAQRIERTSLHRKLKEGVLGHEDEKFSYIAVSKKAVDLPSGRVLRHPLKRSGHISLTLCTSEGIKNEVISKKSGEVYKNAKKIEWGDAPNINLDRSL